MPIAHTLKQYLKNVRVHYRMVPHDHAAGGQRSAQAAPVPGSNIAISVLFKDHLGYVMAVVPATHRVDAGKLRQELHRPLDLAGEPDVKRVFKDCAPGAVPPMGQAYGVDVIWDGSLSKCADVYFEAGDHTELVHVSGHDFQRLMSSMDCAAISQPAERALPPARIT